MYGFRPRFLDGIRTVILFSLHGPSAPGPPLYGIRTTKMRPVHFVWTDSVLILWTDSVPILWTGSVHWGWLGGLFGGWFGRLIWGVSRDAFRGSLECLLESVWGGHWEAYWGILWGVLWGRICEHACLPFGGCICDVHSRGHCRFLEGPLVFHPSLDRFMATCVKRSTRCSMELINAKSLRLWQVQSDTRCPRRSCDKFNFARFIFAAPEADVLENARGSFVQATVLRRCTSVVPDNYDGLCSLCF